MASTTTSPAVTGTTVPIGIAPAPVVTSNNSMGLVPIAVTTKSGELVAAAAAAPHSTFIMTQIDQEAALKGQLVKYCGPATDWKSYIDTSTKGGQALRDLALRGNVAFENLCSFVRQNKSKTSSLFLISSIQEAIDATKRTTQNQLTVLNAIMQQKAYREDVGSCQMVKNQVRAIE